MKFEIKNRFNGSVLFSLETDSLKLCLEAAIKLKVNLSCADLRGANLRGANLRDGIFRCADLRGADLLGANLLSADFSGADFSGANLNGANLRGASLRAADLSGADLRGADLLGANLHDADLNDAHLTGANLLGASLLGATYTNGSKISTPPLQLLGTKYDVLILDTHIKIGCEFHSQEEWANFTDDEIAQMDKGALEWWKELGELVLSMSIGHQQRIARMK